MRLPPSARRPLLLTALLALPAAACSSRHDELVPTGLPAEFAVRSDVPFVRGTIVERDEWAGTLRIRVRDRAGSDARVTEAVATVLPDAVLRWPDGRVAMRAELTVGRPVMVYITGPVLESQPPQVTANGILVGRR